jgi:hypothetical protein
MFRVATVQPQIMAELNGGISEEYEIVVEFWL